MKEHVMERDDTNPVLRAKLRVNEVLQRKNSEGGTDTEIIKLQAVYGPEGSDNAKWSKWTPQATFEIHINNPEAFGTLSTGHEFYVDFTPAVQAAHEVQTADAAG
jgi:hypothetical protein